MVPKVPNPSRMGKFTLIPCCNIIKCITMLANTLKLCLLRVISPVQTAFISGHSMAETFSCRLRNWWTAIIKRDQVDVILMSVSPISMFMGLSSQVGIYHIWIQRIAKIFNGKIFLLESIATVFFFYRAYIMI